MPIMLISLLVVALVAPDQPDLDRIQEYVRHDKTDRLAEIKALLARERAPKPYPNSGGGGSDWLPRAWMDWLVAETENLREANARMLDAAHSGEQGGVSRP